MDRFMAFFCGICPLCTASRMWPRSALRRLVLSYGRVCPFCSARRRLMTKPNGEESGSKLTDGVVLLLWACLVVTGPLLAFLLS
jgi:hypothetical protein